MTEAWSRAFDIDFRRGKVGEDLVGTFLESVEGSLIEVKTDYRAGETGNVYIETYQKTERDGWVPSGINVTDSQFFALAGSSGHGFIVVKTDVLTDLARVAPEVGINATNMNSRWTKGRLVRVTDIVSAIFERGNQIGSE